MNLIHRATLIMLMVWYGLATSAKSEEANLKYQSASFGRQFEVATARLFKFADDKPADLVVEENVLGAGQHQFGQFDFGVTAGRQVAILIVNKNGHDNQFDLYVDANRDRRINADEKVPGKGRIRTFELTAIPDEVQTIRKVRLRKSNTTNGFSIQTLGGTQGKCLLEDKNVKVRRIDGDGNGLFADVRDQIWIDLDGDGKWNRISERFPYQMALRMDSKRFLVRGDQVGVQFNLKPVEGEGDLSVDLDLADPQSKVEAFSLSLFGDDGASFRIDSLQPQKMPVGKYKVGSLSLLMTDNDSPKPWYFSFSHSGRDGEGKWFEVTKDNKVVVDPLGEFRFGFTGDKYLEVGSDINVRPFLVTETELYLRASSRHEPDKFGDFNGNSALITAMDGDGNIIDQTTSGFR